MFIRSFSNSLDIARNVSCANQRAVLVVLLRVFFGRLLVPFPFHGLRVVALKSRIIEFNVVRQVAAILTGQITTNTTATSQSMPMSHSILRERTVGRNR